MKSGSTIMGGVICTIAVVALGLHGHADCRTDQLATHSYQPRTHLVSEGSMLQP